MNRVRRDARIAAVLFCFLAAVHGPSNGSIRFATAAPQTNGRSPGDLPSLLRFVVGAIAVEPPKKEQIERWTRLLPESPRGVGPTIEDRAAWRTMAGIGSLEGVVKQAERLSAQPPPELTDEMYLDFSRTGNRRRYETALNNRQNALGILATAECVENRGRFLPAIEKTIRSVCSQKTWVLPAHDRGLNIFKGTELDIDLNAALFSWELATVRYWLGGKLAPEIRRLVDDELERRIFAPFAGALATGKPKLWWLTYENNWNAVCLSGVIGSALAAIDSRPRRAYFASAGEKYIAAYLRGFTPDGYCSEGLGYWNYGFGHYAMLAETLRRASGGKVDLLDRPDVRKIALFGRRLEIPPGVYPAFADCSFAARPDPSLTALLNRRYGWGLKDADARSNASRLAATPYMLATCVFADAASAAATEAADAADTPPRDWFSDAGVLICRPSPTAALALGAAMKGGHNAEQHNHNDVGSFVVALGRSAPLTDPGSEIYTARTFSNRRYESKVLNSFGHPVPRVAGQLQIGGRRAAARALKTDFTANTDTLALDLTAAYKVKELKKLERTFVFSRQGRGSLTVADRVEFDSPQTFETALITFDEWKQLAPDLLQVGQKPDRVAVKIAVSGGEFRLNVEKIEEQLPGGRRPTRIGIELTKPVERAAVEMTITPAP